VKGKANALRTELVKKRRIDEETNGETWTLCKKRREMNAWQDIISHLIDVSKELDAKISFPKIHLMSHLVAQIRPYVALQQYFSERHEQVHQTHLKGGWNASNHNLNYLPQVINFQRRIICFEIRDLNRQALTQRRDNSAASCKVLPSDNDLAAPLSSHSYSKPEFMVPYNRLYGQHPDATIKDF
jgi:hypothetical protein